MHSRRQTRSPWRPAFSPGKPTDRNWFFTYCSQLIWKHLLVEHQPDAHEMAHLMQHSDPLIDLVVQGTELEQMMAENAQQQRAGVISHLTQVAYALRQIPEKGRRPPASCTARMEPEAVRAGYSSRAARTRGTACGRSKVCGWTGSLSAC